MNSGPVLIVNDDNDDKELLLDAWNDLGYTNTLIFFTTGEEVLAYLNSNKPTPFLILCEVNLARMNGFELKERIMKNRSANNKSIPFIFWSTEASGAQIEKAYDLGGNGFFIKENTYTGLQKSLNNIVSYWSKSVVPESQE